MWGRQEKHISSGEDLGPSSVLDLGRIQQSSTAWSQSGGKAHFNSVFWVSLAFRSDGAMV